MARRPKPKSRARPAPEPAQRSLDRVFLVVLLVVAAAVRVAVFVMTHEQPVWWDEAEYLVKGRHIALGTPDTGFFVGRPMGLPLLIAGFYAVGLGETAIRVAMVVMAIAGVILVYRVGRRLVGELAGFAGALLFSFFYLPVFFAGRIMTEIPHSLLVLLAIDLLTSGVPRRLLLAGPVFALAVMTRFPAVILAPVLAVYALVAQRQHWRVLLGSAALAACVVAPYGLWVTATYGDPLHTLRASSYLMASGDLAARLPVLIQHVEGLVKTLGPVALSYLAVGALSVAWRWRSHGAGAVLLLALWPTALILYFGLSVVFYQDRFIILALPPLFLIMGHAVAWLATWIAPRHAVVAAGLAVAAIAVAAVGHARAAFAMVEKKRTMYDHLRDAGLFIREHSQPEDRVISSSVAQLTYYSERPGVQLPDEREELVRVMRELAPRFAVFSGYEKHPEWLPSFRLNQVGLALRAQFPKDDPFVQVFSAIGSGGPGGVP